MKSHARVLEQAKKMDWKYYEPKTDVEYSINTFDDGNDEYKYYTNVWYVYGNWLGKVAIVNKRDKTMRIKSISAWKLSEVL